MSDDWLTLLRESTDGFAASVDRADPGVPIT